MINATASLISGISIACSTVCSGADNISKLRVTGLCEITSNRWIAPYKWSVMQKIFLFDDAIMTFYRTGKILIILKNNTFWITEIFLMGQWVIKRLCSRKIVRSEICCFLWKVFLDRFVFSWRICSVMLALVSMHHENTPQWHFNWPLDKFVMF